MRALWILLASVVFSVAKSASAEERRLDCVAYQLGQNAESLFHYQEALSHYNDSIQRHEHGACAEDTRRRIESLLSYSEGNFGPFEQLERARHTSDIEHNLAMLESLRIAADSFPNGRVRGEARLLVGLAFASNAEQRTRAPSILDAVVRDPFAAPATRKQALRSATDLLWQLDVREGVRLVSRNHAIASIDLVNEAKKHERRFWAHRATVFLLALFCANSLFAIGRQVAARRFDAARLGRRAVRSLSFGVLVGGAGAAIVSFYERGHTLPFLLLGVSIVAVAILADAWRLANDGKAPHRTRVALRLLLSASAVLSSAYLILESIDVRYLEAFGC